MPLIEPKRTNDDLKSGRLTSALRLSKGLGVTIGRWQALEAAAGPPMAEYRCQWVEVLSYLAKLITAQQVDEIVVVSEVVAHVASPTVWLLAPKDCDATKSGYFKRFSPFEPRPC